jgi:hypothetical protein
MLLSLQGSQTSLPRKEREYMGVQNLLYNLPFPPHPNSFQIKCKIHIQGAPSFLLLSFYIVENKNLNTKLIFKGYLFAILQYDYLAICINSSRSIT